MTHVIVLDAKPVSSASTLRTRVGLLQPGTIIPAT
jgi:hypothetical protein